MGTLVASSKNLGNVAVERMADSRRMFEASNGQLIAILEDTSGSLTYSTAPAAGTPWSSPTTLFTGAAANLYSAMLYLSDVLYVFYMDASTLHLAKVAYTTGSNTFGTATIVDVVTSGVSGVQSIDAGWDTARSLFYVFTAESDAVEVFHCDNAGQPAGQQATPEVGHMSAGVSARILGVQVVPGTPATSYLLIQNGSTTGTLYLVTVTFDGANFAAGATETVPVGTTYSAACALDQSNNLDIVAVDSSGKLQAVKRTGANAYSTPVNIASGVATASPLISLSTDGTGGLTTFFKSLANQPNGEIYVVKRPTGQPWGTAALFAGGDSAGYGVPRSASGMVGTHIDFLYQTGTSSPFSVYYAALPNGSAPNTPVPLSPSGNETSLTPTLSYQYSNPNPLDGQGKTEYQVKLGATIEWDSGAITTSATANVYGTNSNVSDPGYVAPVALVYGNTYTWSVRNQDAVSGLWSGWSTPVSFTPVQGGTVTITQLSDNSVVSSSSPVTLGAPQFDSITASVTQPQGHSFDKYHDIIWDSTLSTIIDQTGDLTITSGLASGASFTSPSWLASHLQNGQTYKLIRSYRDATTLLWSDSASWTLNTSWAPPPSVTGLTVVVDVTRGTITPSWTNPGAAVSAIVTRSAASSGLYTTLPKTGLFSTLTDYAPFGSWDYQVVVVNALGISSTPVTESNVTLSGTNGMYGVCLTDSVYPTIAQVWFGPLDQGDWRNASGFKYQDDVASQTPFGQETPYASKRLQDFGFAQSRAYSIPETGQDANGNAINGLATIALLLAMRDVYNPCLYRDVMGRFFYVTVENVSPSISQDGPPLYRAEMDFRSVINARQAQPLVL